MSRLVCAHHAHMQHRVQPGLKRVHVQIVQAALLGATPLHCAALRGNVASLDHLLYCGASPTATTAAGLLPLELVPYCNTAGDAASVCRCTPARHAVHWQCRSAAAREMLLQSVLLRPAGSLWRWVARIAAVGKCWLGVWGVHKALWRPQVEQQLERLRTQRSERLQQDGQALAHQAAALAAAAQAELRAAEQRAAALVRSARDAGVAAHGLTLQSAFAHEPRSPFRQDAMHGAPAGTGAEPKVRRVAERVDGPHNDDAGTEHAMALQGAAGAMAKLTQAVSHAQKLAADGFLMRPDQLRAAQAEAAPGPSVVAALTLMLHPETCQ